MAPNKMKGGELTKEQQQVLADLAAKGLKYGAKKFAKSDLGKELGGTISNLASSAFSSLFGNGVSGGAKGDQRRFMANRAVPNRVPNSVRVREMRDVKDYNRNQQQRVFDMEKRQVQSESESIKPVDAKDAGAAFKLQTYISKVQQILSQKADIFSQLQATPITDLSRLKGPDKRAGLLTMITSKAEFVQAYNEMVAYVSLFFKDIQLDNRVRDRMYASYFTPLIDQMRQLSQSYPSLFKDLPAPVRAEERQPETRDGKVYDLVRQELRDMYSLLNVAADNIQDGIFRPIGAKDVAEFTRDNDVNATFARNPPPPKPIQDSLAVKQARQQVAIAQDLQAANQRAALARAAEIAERNPYDPRGDPELDPETQARYAQLQLRTGEQDRIYPLRSAENLNQDVMAGRLGAEEGLNLIGTYLGMGVILGAPGLTMPEIEAAYEAINGGNAAPLFELYNSTLPTIQIYNDWVQSRGVLAPPEVEERPPSPRGEERRPPPEREMPAPAPAQRRVANDAEIDDAVLVFIDRNNFPRDQRMPFADSGKGEFGGERWRPLTRIGEILDERGLRSDQASKVRAIKRYNETKPKQKPGRKKKEQEQQAGPAEDPQQQQDIRRFLSPTRQQQGQQGGPAPEQPPEEEGEQFGSGMSGGRLRSHQNLRGRSGRELDFVPAKSLNSAAPPVSFGYGSHHRPKFAWEEEEDRAGGRYIRQDRIPYNLHGGLGMVNPDNEIGAYQVLRMAGEVGRGMSGGVYLPKEYVVQPAGEKEFFGYGVDGDNDMFGEMGGYGSLKRRLAGGMVNPFAVSKDYHYKPADTGYDDAMDFAYGNHEEPLESAQQAHEEEEEKPVDLDENPNPFRVRNENYKVNTGKMKKVSYKMPDK